MNISPCGPMPPSVTILQATDYNGEIVPLGLSVHGKIFPPPGTPMVEFHLKLPGVETPDSDFSFTPDEAREYIRAIRERDNAKAVLK